jgi:hypothetical protein
MTTAIDDSTLPRDAPHSWSLDELAKNIRSCLNRAKTSETRANDLRITAAKMLLEARERIETALVEKPGRTAEGYRSWKHYRSLNFSRSDRDIRKCLALAKSGDPEAALEAERAERRQSMARLRTRSHMGPPAAIPAPEPRPMPAPVQPPTAPTIKMTMGEAAHDTTAAANDGTIVEWMTATEIDLLHRVEGLLETGASDAFRHRLTDLLCRTEIPQFLKRAAP